MQGIFPIDYPVSYVLPIFLKLLISAVLGGAVGYEREIHERPAGLRTHVLVCTGATLLMVLSLSMHNDPGRIAAQIVSGVGFLGAGTILRQGNVIHGLTTAASLWMVSAIGMAVGMGGIFLLVALFASVLVFGTLSVLRAFEPFLGKRNALMLRVRYRKEQTEVLSGVMHALSETGVEVDSVLSCKAMEDSRVYTMRILLPIGIVPETIMQGLEGVEGLDSFKLN